jgi:DNA polymerase III epsilon subunit-like protein
LNARELYQSRRLNPPGPLSPNYKRFWLGALKSLEEKTSKEEKQATGVLSSVDKILGSLIQRGDKSAKSPAPSPNGEETSSNITDANPKKVRRTLVVTQDQRAEEIANLKGESLVALDLETTGLDPRRDSIRLLSLATRATTYIVDCQSVDPAGLFPILAEVTVVAHNPLFDLRFLSSIGFVPGKVADTMILSQLLHAGSKEEPLKRGQTSHSLGSVVERELGLELDKAHQSGDWGGTLTPEMVEYAAKDVEVLLPLYEVLMAKIEEASLTYVAEIEHRTLPAVVWMSGACVAIEAEGWREHARKAEARAARLPGAAGAGDPLPLREDHQDPRRRTHKDLSAVEGFSYLIAYCRFARVTRAFQIDRILSARITEERFAERKDEAELPGAPPSR